ncbi:MAG TPA: YceI family protein [Rudaea sp.]
MLRWPAALLVLLLGTGAGAQETHDGTTTAIRMIDSAHSRAEFEVKVLWLVGVHGSFDAVYGEVAIDRFRSMARVDARIHVNNVTMRNHKYEDWVKSDEFFDVKNFPEIRFVSDWFELGRLETGGALEGVLTMRGTEHRERFEIAPSDCIASAVSTCPAIVTGSVRRSDFGMHSRRGALSDKVELSFSIYVSAEDNAAAH